MLACCACAAALQAAAGLRLVGNPCPLTCQGHSLLQDVRCGHPGAQEQGQACRLLGHGVRGRVGGSILLYYSSVNTRPRCRGGVEAAGLWLLEQASGCLHSRRPAAAPQ